MELGLRKKCALVTGGSHGIGLATADALAAEGCNVAICARDRARLDEAVRQLKGRGGEAIGVPADAMISADIACVVEETVKAFGTIHILVNNVGGGGRWGKPSVEETDEQVWLDVINKNALAAARFTRLALTHMRMQKWGRVVTVASIYGHEAGGRPWFNMAKAAQISLMKTLSLDRSLTRDGITFNTVAPGAIMIPDTGWDRERKTDPEAFNRMVESEFTLGRCGSPKEVADVIAFLCSENASLVNGACIPVDGGQSRAF